MADHDFIHDSTHAAYPTEGNMDSRQNMGADRKTSEETGIDVETVQSTPLAVQEECRNLQQSQQQSSPFEDRNNHHRPTDNNGCDSMGRTLPFVLQQHKDSFRIKYVTTNRLSTTTSQSTHVVGKYLERGQNRPQTSPSNTQRFVALKETENHQVPIWSGGCWSAQYENLDRCREATGNSEYYPEESRRIFRSASGGLELWELCRDHSLELFGEPKYQVPNQNTHCKHSERKCYASVRELPNDRDFSSLLGLLKVNRRGIHEVKSEHFLDQEELEYIKKGTPITEVRELFEDHSGQTIWFIDSQGFLFEWCRMVYELRFVGHSVEEGLINVSDHPENILFWNDGEWLSKEDSENGVGMVREMFMNMMDKVPEMSEMGETSSGEEKQEETRKRRSKKSRKDGRSRRNKHRK